MILAALAEKVISWNNVTKVHQFITIFRENVKTDLSTANLAFFATEGIKVDLNNGLTAATLPGDGTKTYRGYKWCYELKKEESLAILNQYVNPYIEPLTLDDVDFLTLP
jgi:anionic cell wall polymer biosynthesis LytR-Cps2A-Psr (LCP) family protein